MKLFNNKMIFGTFLLILCFLYLFSPYLAESASALTESHMMQNTNIQGNRVLVVAPHPDDEVLGGGGVIEKAISSGKQVKVVIMTNGDGFSEDVMRQFITLFPSAQNYQKLGVLRHEESIQALGYLGVKPSDIYFLGYPDGGLESLWETNWSCTRLYRGLTGWTHANYPFSYQKNAPYCGENVVNNLSQIIRSFQPTTIVFPDPYDEHPDHWATNAFVQFTLANLHYHPADKWTYLVHFSGFLGSWRNNSLLSAIPPNALTKLDTRWINVPLSNKEQQKKLESLNEYPTQTKIMLPWMKQFVRKNDLLEVYPDLTWHTKGNWTKWSFADITGDSFLQHWTTSDDIISVGGKVNGHRLYIDCTTRFYSTHPVRFRFHIRVFYEHGNKLADFTVQLKRQQENEAKIFKPKTIQIALPLSDAFLNHADSFLISVDTLSGNKQIDRTAWRYVQIKN
ncbi:PIG-L deacetylase family protein [Polycladomyces subterraneus]|uniref:PIG-L family deacetylase n=1 Tax=Polycladomyces subterraneus TaxID=1016997 RepID=A0ABT8INI3_9BACL|nr:PIG-L family deacetylase [Polycladomyces subterraneus]MDN4594313.1 PIG-L family deacetylase [Polycladomyces subterraneus]